MTKRILIWGAGAIGGTVGAYLARSGHDVTFVDVVAEHVQAIKRGGLHITGPVDSFTSVPGGAFTPDELTGVWSHVYLAVKSQHTSEAVRALVVHLAPDGYVLSLQNGLCELEIAKSRRACTHDRSFRQLRCRLDRAGRDHVRQSGGRRPWGISTAQ